MTVAPGQWLAKLLKSLEIPAPEAAYRVQRIEVVERRFVLPIKIAAILMLVHSFRTSPWFGTALSALDVAVDTVQTISVIYIAVNVVIAVVLFLTRRLPFVLIRWSVFASSLVDAVFLAGVTLLTGGYDSVLYWLFVGLIVRNAASIPPAWSQLVLNLCTCVCYVSAGILDIAISENVAEAFVQPMRGAIPVELPESPTENLLIRVAVLLLTTACCYGLQVLIEKQRLAVEEARESGLREGQLRLAGRLAAEIAHQIKNPLAIINTAAFSVQRALQAGKPNPRQQLAIIQEEVERADRIITQVMGYAQLCEGHVERLSVTEELDRALAHVFPPAAGYAATVERHCAAHLPPLLMQRSHLAEILNNLLLNAREATEGHGRVVVSARAQPDNAVEIGIGDDGPGIPPDKQARIFEAYYTTKAKGTGLGLAIVKHNVELYGGSVRVESALGKGARFTVVFPAKTKI